MIITNPLYTLVTFLEFSSEEQLFAAPTLLRKSQLSSPVSKVHNNYFLEPTLGNYINWIQRVKTQFMFWSIGYLAASKVKVQNTNIEITITFIGGSISSLADPEQFQRVDCYLEREHIVSFLGFTLSFIIIIIIFHLQRG